MSGEELAKVVAMVISGEGFSTAHGSGSGADAEVSGCLGATLPGDRLSKTPFFMVQSQGGAAERRGEERFVFFPRPAKTADTVELLLVHISGYVVNVWVSECIRESGGGKEKVVRPWRC